MRSFIEQNLLPKINKPTRYIGNEWNEIKKDWEECSVKFAFLFPDVYEVGMSHLGLRILYHVVNNQPRFLMERAFTPWVDMENLMRENDIPLFSLESYKPVRDFDVVGFTLQYEMSYTNIINMLDLGGIPIKTQNRSEDDPLVMAGGPCAFNPEPLADFIDFFVLGEGEEVILEIMELMEKAKEAGKINKTQFLKDVARIKGVYVPSFYKVDYKEDSTISEVASVAEDTPSVVYKRVVENFSESEFPVNTLVPNTETVHDRIMLEVLRGCSRGCRFCQAGVIYRPVRERSQEKLLEQAEKLVAATGYNEIALTSLSTADYTCVEPLIKELINKYKEKGVGVSLPSLRVDAFSVDLAKEIQKVRKTGLTFAPEAGTQRLRDVINKGVTEENIIETLTGVFSSGWTSVKLYFMIGLPTETYEDLDGIVELTKKVLSIGRKVKPSEVRKPIKVTVSISSFVPKAHTPFQWQGQDSRKSLTEKQQYLKENIRKLKGVTLNYHDVGVSFMESAFARGGRRLGHVLETAWRLGCKFDGWSEHFKYDLWLKAFDDCSLNPEFFANRDFGFEEVLPWDHLSSGVSKKWMIKEYKTALEEKRTGDCRTIPCHACGVCPEYKVWPDIKGGKS